MIIGLYNVVHLELGFIGGISKVQKIHSICVIADEFLKYDVSTSTGTMLALQRGNKAEPYYEVPWDGTRYSK